MPMVWNNESSTKLLFGILTQIRENSIKLDYSKLAQHMGPECTVSAIRGYISRQSGKVNDGPSVDKRPKTPRAPRTPKKRKLKETSSEEEPEFESGLENLQNIDALDALIKTEKDGEESTSSLRDDDMICAPVKLEDMDRMFENDI